MRIEHIALWTNDIERCKKFYVSYFGAIAGAGYVNPQKGFESCFLSFGDGARMEIMKTTMLAPVPVEPGAQRMGFTHFAIALGSEQLVDELTRRIKRRLPGYRRAAPDGGWPLRKVVLDPDGNRVVIAA
jgi:lactoylglutathione lyase